jgi:hypothetical protein
VGCTVNKLNPKEVQKQIKSGQLVIKQKWSYLNPIIHSNLFLITK